MQGKKRGRRKVYRLTIIEKINGTQVGKNTLTIVIPPYTLFLLIIIIMLIMLTFLIMLLVLNILFLILFCFILHASSAIVRTHACAHTQVSHALSPPHKNQITHLSVCFFLTNKHFARVVWNFFVVVVGNQRCQCCQRIHGFDDLFCF